MRPAKAGHLAVIEAKILDREYWIARFLRVMMKLEL
jgi:hypothetical protein